jgi:hypothetical protein
MAKPQKLDRVRVLALALEQTKGTARVKVADQLAQEVRKVSDEALVWAAKGSTVTKVAKELGITRQAAQQRVEGARKRTGGGS